jgi:predicted nucleic acid-binding protein
VSTYFDTSAIVAVYAPERYSKNARRALVAAPQVPFTQLHEVEVLNALELMVGRGMISRVECMALQEQLNEDKDARRFARLGLDLDRVFELAQTLSSTYSARFLSRSLDLLHVAAAHTALCSTFVSADDRQLAVAKATNLTTVDIKKSRRRSAR